MPSAHDSSHELDLQLLMLNMATESSDRAGAAADLFTLRYSGEARYLANSASHSSCRQDAC